MLVYTTSCVEVEKALQDRADTVTATDLARSVPTLWPEQGRSGPAAPGGSTVEGHAATADGRPVVAVTGASGGIGRSTREMVPPSVGWKEKTATFGLSANGCANASSRGADRQ